MKQVIFEYYDRNEFQEFLDSLPAKDAAKLVVTISQIETYGLEIAKRQEWVKQIERGLYEIRSTMGSNIQRAIYFQVIGSRFMISHVFTKKQQQTPTREIKKGIRRREIYWNRRNHDDLD